MNLYHQILNVSENASKATIRKSYLSLCKKYHPDINNNNDTEKMALINEAYYSLITHTLPTGPETNKSGTGNNITKYKDQAYAFYRQGLKLYNESDLNMSIGGNNYSTKRKSMFVSEEDNNLIKNKILQSLYYFNIVCVQYPENPWISDTLEKMRKLNMRLSSLKK